MNAPKSFARVLIKNSKAEFLAIKQVFKASFLWNFPGGKVEPGETAQEAAIRETEEEIGLKIHDMSFLLEECYTINNIKWQGSFFFAHSFSGILQIKEPEKITEVGYFSLEALKNLEEIDFVFSEIAGIESAQGYPPSIQKF